MEQVLQALAMLGTWQNAAMLISGTAIGIFIGAMPGLSVNMGLALLFPVVSISYEFNRLVGRHDNRLTRFLSAPGMWFQNFTTNEPDDSMIECAIAAMEKVIPGDGSDQW